MLFFKSVFVLFFILIVSGCGTSSTPSIDSTTVSTTLPDPVTTIPADISCNGIANLPFETVSATNEEGANIASNTIDHQFFTDNYWSTKTSNQSLILTLQEVALVKGVAITWLNEDSRSYNYDIEISKDNTNWTPVLTNNVSNSATNRSEYNEIPENTAKYIKIITNGNSVDNSSNIIEVEAFGCTNDVATSIELDDWYLSIPVDETINSKSESISETTLANGYFNHQFFFLDLDGGLVFRAPIEGAKTSSNTKYTRTELREMLRRGDTSIKTQGINGNNWVFSSASLSEQQAAGGVDGVLTSELAVNYVTTTGDSSQVGRVIIGQIHANDDEPIRVYYRKLPGNTNGSIYLAHEILNGDDIYYEIVGERSKSASNPIDGIALNERFSYTISVTGNELTFTLHRTGKSDKTQIIDMSQSGYDSGGQYMYFKAGVYNQNSTGNKKDYVQATFYNINNTHIGYSF